MQDDKISHHLCPIFNCRSNNYYTKLITNNPEWRFAGIYAERVSGTGREHRDEFDRMMADCRGGKIVQTIFDLYLQGNGVRKIKKYLESNGIKTVTGKTEWSTSTIDRMMSNEKYIDDALLQKTITTDCLTGKRVKNIGQAERYYVENDHEAIISREIFEKVQRKKQGKMM